MPNEPAMKEHHFDYGYWIASTEITNLNYAHVTGRIPSTQPTHPKTNVSWHQANAYCQRLTMQERKAGRIPEGHAYRLPTEKEWERAARGGQHTAYNSGNEPDVQSGHFNDSPTMRQFHRITPLPVGQFEPNALGLYDVLGNVAEWTSDLYRARLNYTEFNPLTPDKASQSTQVSVRGGSMLTRASEARFAEIGRAHV